MGKRFFTNFIIYMKEHYPGRANYSKFPTALINRWGKPAKAKDFTLGTLAYVLCYLHVSDLTDEQKINNEEKLLEYSKAKLFPDKDEQEIKLILEDYAEEVEAVKEDYRNPSAHTNQLRKVNAKECFDLIIDVEKLLKRMLDSFDE